MITKKIYRIFIPVLLATGLIAGGVSCKKYNDWQVDESHDRLFRPTNFTVTTDIITVTLKWKNMPSTNGYTIELSEDSLAFGSILKTYSGGASKDADGFVFVIPELLKSNTRYSVRLKGTDTIGIPQSMWTALTFKTGTEQIMLPVSNTDIAISSVKVQWKIPNEVTHFMIGSVRYDISALEKAAGVKTLTGLTGGTQYTAEIYYNNVLRGKQTFKTFAPNPSGPNVVRLNTAADLITLLPTAVAGTVFIVPQGAVYSYEDPIVLPAGASLLFWGEDGVSKPIISVNVITLPATAGTVRFENLDFTGFQDGDPAKTKRSYIFNQSAASITAKIVFENCTIRNLVNTPIRMQGANAITVDSVIVNRCLAYDIGDNGGAGTYAFINSNVATGKVNNIKITNSTFYTIGLGLILHSAAPSQSVLIDNCTFNNAIGNGRYLIDYNTQAVTSFTIRNTIIGKTLSPLATARGVRAATVPTVINSYKTLDAVISANPISSITDYTKNSTDLFTNPGSGNFLIKDNTFAGRSDSGDPRWRP